MCFCLFGCQQNTKIEDVEKNGRYQLHSGTFEDLSVTVGPPPTSSREKRPGIFKIDTQTGKTWMYFDTIILNTNSVSTSSGWLEITNRNNSRNLR